MTIIESHSVDCVFNDNRNQKYIGLFDLEKNETRHPIESLDDIYSFSDELKRLPLYTTKTKADNY